MASLGARFCCCSLPPIRHSPSVYAHAFPAEASFPWLSFLPSRESSIRTYAKFQRFEQAEEDGEAQAAAARAESNGTVFVDGDGQTGAVLLQDEKSDDSVLPNDLEGAVLHSSESTAYFVSAGGTRAIVELLLPELENLNEEGAQQRLWDLARLYLEALQNDLGTKVHFKNVKIDYV